MKVRATCLPERPFLVQTVDKEDGGLCDGHEEVTHSQIHDEVVGRCPELLVTETENKGSGF